MIEEKYINWLMKGMQIMYYNSEQKKPITVNDISNNNYLKFYWFLIRNDYYKKMKNDSKILYCIMMDRASLSIKNKWFDERNIVYIIMTNKEIEKILNMSEPTIIKCKKELVKHGLIEEKRQGFNKPNLIFLFNDNIDKFEGPQQAKEADQQTNNVTKLDKTIISKDSNFEKVWKSFPGKKNKKYVKKESKELINNTDIAILEKIIKKYLNDKDLEINGGWKKVQNGSTFFNNIKDRIIIQSAEEKIKIAEVEEKPIETNEVINKEKVDIMF